MKLNRVLIRRALVQKYMFFFNMLKKLQTAYSDVGFWRRDLALGMGDGESALFESRHGAAAGRESGKRRRRVGVHLHKRLPGDLSGLHDAARGPRAATRAIRRPGWKRRWLRAASQDPGPGPARLAGRVSGRLEVTPQLPSPHHAPRLHASTPAWFRARA